MLSQFSDYTRKPLILMLFQEIIPLFPCDIPALIADCNQIIATFESKTYKSVDYYTVKPTNTLK